MANQWQGIKLRSEKKMLRIAKNSFKVVAKNVNKRSPIDTGRFRENWNTSINQPDGSVDLLSGSGLLPITSALRLGESIFYTNSLPYNFRLEFGWSNQAPRGMLRISVAEWSQIVDREAKKIK